MEIAGTLRDRLTVSPLVRRTTALLVLALGAVWLSANEVGPAKLLAIAVLLALFVAPLIAPRRHRYIRKPKELAVLNGDFGRSGGKSEMSKRSYSPPHLREFASGALSDLEWEPGDDGSFQALRPFYLVHAKRDGAVLAVRLKFSGDRTFQGWQPVATVASQDADAGHPDEAHQWMLIGYVPPGIQFDAQLRLSDSESRPRVGVMRDLLVPGDRSFQSVHLKISKDKRFATSA